MSNRIPKGWKVYEFDGVWHFAPDPSDYPRPGVTFPEIYGSTHYHYDGTLDVAVTRNHARKRLARHLKSVSEWGAWRCRVPSEMRRRAVEKAVFFPELSDPTWADHFRDERNRYQFRLPPFSR